MGAGGPGGGVGRCRITKRKNNDRRRQDPGGRRRGYRRDSCRRRARRRGRLCRARGGIGRGQAGGALRAGGGAQRAPSRREGGGRSEEHTSELQSLMRISYAVFCLKKKTQNKINYNIHTNI